MPRKFQYQEKILSKGVRAVVGVFEESVYLLTKKSQKVKNNQRFKFP